MQIVDRYISGQFLRSFIFGLVAFNALLLLIQALQLTRLESDKPRIHLYLYLLYSTPGFFVRTLPMALTFSVCFTTAHFTKTRELVALYSAGRSFYRALTPLFVAAAISTALSFVLTNTVAPVATRLANQEQDQYKKGAPRALMREMVFQKNIRGRKGFYFLYYFDREANKVIGGFNYIQLQADGTPEWMVEAQEARLNPQSGEWQLSNARRVRFDSEGLAESVENAASLSLYFPDEPDTFTRPARDPKELNALELFQEVGRLHALGFDAAPYEVRLHAIFAESLVCIILAVAASIAGHSGNHRGGNPLVRSILISAGAIVLYFVLFNLGESLGGANVLPPAVAGWGPTGFFLAVAGFMVLRFRR
ncbi:MAG: LptF/LptG family permease [Leptospirales bacterium]|nr:LptF/LptG family permease [Leptospirales bacterium]